ncbi:hypothetical protein CLV63_105192 [Murinocardiopsis flavida]|uniref:Uncharacterized protein n=1 Tax=Murinocardiopsis flavida TaxID=645275 RepID=A0A2P8DMT5_9ACTN|nr:DUF6243 family protein [Murinocardiopsis flavida]PSK98518.1 hypothetical protein CLV63_105192 [Murinocardiopsis flavida]
MPTGRNNMLGIGGQRSKHSKSALRGAPAKGQRGGGDAQAAKRELLRKIQERSRNGPGQGSGGNEAS